MIPHTELKLRRDKIRSIMADNEIDAALISCNVNLLYTYGQVICGYLYIPLNSPAWVFIKRPNNLSGERLEYIRKPEDIAKILQEKGMPLPKKMMLEGDELPFTSYSRIAAAFPETECVNGTPIIREARSIKTDIEINMFRKAAKAHAKAYNQIPSLYKEGMTDLELSIEIERIMRLEGCLGLFRVFGQSMEIFMGSVLTGNNAATPSPYDFALGGKGLDSSLPVGLNGKDILEGQSIMVDMGGNFNGYMSDMSRVFSKGKLNDEAYTAHNTCLEIQEEISNLAKPGVACCDLYQKAIDMVSKAGFESNFMGIQQKAKFIGHGIGLEINEAPVIAPRAKQELQSGMVFALEPKIILPNVGPLGIENSFVVTEEGVDKLTHCEEQIIEL